MFSSVSPLPSLKASKLGPLMIVRVYGRGAGNANNVAAGSEGIQLGPALLQGQQMRLSLSLSNESLGSLSSSALLSFWAMVLFIPK